jgi:hypothetical protein
MDIKTVDSGRSVHDWDGKLSDIYINAVNIDNKYLVTPLSYNDCIDEIIDDSKRIGDKKIQRIVTDVIKTIKTSSKGNHDGTNNVHFEDVLPRVWKFYRLMPDSDKSVFYEQVFDMHTGMCPQGRAGARLLQLYFSWIEGLQMYLKDSKPVDVDVCNIFSQLKNNNV